MPADFGLVLPESSPRGSLTKWMDDLDVILPRLAGHFKSLWMTDHLFWGETFSFEVWTALSFLAARWPQYDIGAVVMCQSYRNPALLAKMAATLQVLSQGRLILGVGAGWKQDEYRGFNYPFPPMSIRQEQLIDTLEILRRMWTQSGSITYEGKHYSVNGAPLEPKPQPLPPIIVGGGGDRTLRIAAQYADWWNLYDANAHKFRERAAILKQQCEALDRDPGSIRLTWFGRMVVGRNEAEARARGTARDDITFTPDNSLYGTPAQVAQQLAELIDAGVSYFMLDVIGLPHPDVFAMLLDEILPILR